MPVMNMFPGGSTLQIPLEACTDFSASAGNAKAELTWTDPLDKYATPEGEVSDTGDQLVSEWDHTILVRKTGSQPAGPNDGTVVVSSSVRNQYQTTPYTDSGLTNDTEYFYGVFAYNKDGVASSGAFVNATPKAGTPISEQAVGTIIKINENGAPVEYLIVHQGLPAAMYDESCNGCWVLRKTVAPSRVWDSTNNDYKNSDIQAYLNGSWTSRYEPWVMEKVRQVKIPYQDGVGNAGRIESGENGLSCKLFLLGAYELGWTDRWDEGFPEDGVKLDYFTDGTSSSADGKRVAVFDDGGEASWWLRSCVQRGSAGVWRVMTDGDFDGIQCNRDFGVRPAVILDPATLVDQNLNLVP